MNKIITVTFLAIVLVLTGCSLNDSLTICNKEPYKSYLNESEITKTDTISIYHRDSYVTKTVFVEECVLKADGDIEDLKFYEQSFNDTCNQEICQVKGFSYSTKLMGTSLTMTTTYDFFQINIKEELEKGKMFINVQGLIDENFEVPYDEAIKLCTEYGFICEKE